MAAATDNYDVKFNLSAPDKEVRLGLVCDSAYMEKYIVIDAMFGIDGNKGKASIVELA